MRALMYLHKDRHGTFYVRQKVPPKLREAVATVLKNNKTKQTWLKRSLGTKKLDEANIRAKPVLMQFDRILQQAAATQKPRATRTSLSAAEIRRVAEHTYAEMLRGDDELRLNAPEIERDNRHHDELMFGPEDWAARYLSMGFRKISLQTPLTRCLK